MRSPRSRRPIAPSMLAIASFAWLSTACVSLEDDERTLAALFESSGASLENETGTICEEALELPSCAADPPATVVPQRSLFITDVDTLHNSGVDLSLRRVLTKLVNESGEAGLTADALYARLWNTQNPGPDPLGLPRCNDTTDPFQSPLLNGFPYSCRPEGTLASDANANVDGSTLIAVVNRFDLADGVNHCGEYRLIYSKPNPSDFSRALIILEGKVPNPEPGCRDGCRDMQRRWALLSTCGSAVDRATILEEIYFVGAPFGSCGRYEPVVMIDHYGGAPSYAASLRGQIRTNQFMTGPWVLKEFSLRREMGRLVVRPQAVGGNPYGHLFSDGNISQVGLDFRSASVPGAFVGSVPALAINDINRFGFAPDLAARFLAGESEVDFLISDYPAQDGWATDMAFRQAISNAIPNNQACRPRAVDIIERAMAMSCAGCHQMSNNHSLGCGLRWPLSLGFTHVSELSLVSGIDGPRFAISPALQNVFLPARQSTMEAFLASPATCGAMQNSGFATSVSGLSADAPVSGVRVH